MRRYYSLHDDGDKNATHHKNKGERKKRSGKVVAKGEADEEEDGSHWDESEEEKGSPEGSGDESDTSTDVEEVTRLKEPEVGVAIVGVVWC